MVQSFIVTRCPLPGRRIGTPDGPAVHLHSLSASRKAYRDPGWSSRRSSSLAIRRLSRPRLAIRSYRSSSLAIRRQEGVSGPRVVQAFIRIRIGTPSSPRVPGRRIRPRLVQVIIFTRYPPPGVRYPPPGRHPVWSRRSSTLASRRTRYPLPGRRIGTPDGRVHLHSLSASRKAYPDPEWSSRSSSLAIRCQEGVSGGGPCSLSPGRRIRTPMVQPGVHLHSLSAARKAYPDPEWSRRSSSLAIRRQEGVSAPRVVQAFIRTRYPPPGRRILTPSGRGVHLHSLSAARKAYPDPEWSRRSSALAIRLQKGVSGPPVVQPFIFTRSPLPGRRIRTATGPGDYLHSLSAARKAHPDPEWSSRSSSLAIRHQEGVSGPRVVQAFILTRYPPPRSRTRTLDGPAVHLHSLSASRKAYPDPEWSSRSSSLAIRRQEGVSGPRVVQPFIFTRYPPPGRRIRTPSGPGVHLHPLSAARKAYPDHDRSRRLSSLAIRCQEGVSGPRVVQPFIFARYPPPGRRTGTPSVHSFIFTRYSPPGRRIGTPRGPSVHLQSLSAARRAVPDRDWSRRSSSLVYPPPGRRIRSRGANRSS